MPGAVLALSFKDAGTVITTEKQRGGNCHAAAVEPAKKIGDEKDDRFVREHLVEVLGRATDVRLSSRRLERENVADQTQRVTAALARRHDVLHAIGEHQRPGRLRRRFLRT